MKRAHKYAVATIAGAAALFGVGIWWKRPKWPSDIAKERGRKVMAKAFPTMPAKDVDRTLDWLWSQGLTLGPTDPKQTAAKVVFADPASKWLSDGIAASGAAFYPASGEGVV